MRKRIVIGSVGIVIVAIVICFYFRPSERVAPAVLLPYPYVVKPTFSLLRTIEGWIPYSWSWVWKIRDKFRGPQLDLAILVLQTDGTDMKKPDATGEDGTRVWRLTADEVGSLVHNGEHKSTFLMSLGLFTSDGVEGQLNSTSAMSGSNSNYLSYMARLYPAVQGRNIDVFAEVTAKETMPTGVFVRTNLMTSARLQFTDGCGYLILPPTNAVNKGYAALVTATFAKPKVKTTKSSAKPKRVSQ